MKLVMGPAQTLHGRITNSKGEPIEGALVYTEQQALSSLPVDGFCSAKTDKNGEYKITDLKEWVRPKDAGEIHVVSRQGNQVMGEQVPDFVLIRVWHAEYGEKWVECRALPGELNVQLPEVGILTGRAINATTKAPLAGVLVHAEGQARGRDFRARHCVNWAITDRDGNYRFGLRADNDYKIHSNFEGFLPEISPLSRVLRANATATVGDLTLVPAGVVRVHLMDAASKQRIHFSSKPRVSVVLRSRPDWSTEDQVYPTPFVEGNAFLMRAARADLTFSVSVESNDPTISARPGVIVLNVRPGETVEIDLPVDVTKTGGANDKKP
jgi:hypothetical protein